MPPMFPCFLYLRPQSFQTIMRRDKIKKILDSENRDYETCVAGWVRTFRSNRFVALNDGSCMRNLQLVLDFDAMDPTVLKRITTGACLSATGKIISSQGAGQTVEMVVGQLDILGDCDADDYPLQPKKHSLEFLREKGHLRFRTNTFGAVFRMRHLVAYSIHHFFHERGFIYLHSPIITASDAEGAGQMFRVTTLDPLASGSDTSEKKVRGFENDFFGKASHLTVSGQLEGELAATALGEVYTFGPTFRAENSNTPRHLAEFWMVEPEIAFCDLQGNMDLAEEFLKCLIQQAIEKGGDDLQFLDQRQKEEDAQKPVAERNPTGLIDKLKFCLENKFERVTYSEAIDILKNSNPYKKKKFQYPVEWGVDLQSEHERYLVEKHFLKPVILTDYPRQIKAFYMRDNEDGKTVRAMDVLFPGIGEIIGGSQREERLEQLTIKMQEMNIPNSEMSWYLDTRKFGTCPHSGFGLGFERCVQFITGMSNIRDVIPFPRTPGNCDF